MEKCIFGRLYIVSDGGSSLRGCSPPEANSIAVRPFIRASQTQIQRWIEVSDALIIDQVRTAQCRLIPAQRLRGVILTTGEVMRGNTSLVIVCGYIPGLLVKETRIPPAMLEFGEAPWRQSWMMGLLLSIQMRGHWLHA